VTQSSRGQVVILIVEDEELIRMDAADMIRDLGFKVLEAANADQAIALLETNLDISAVFSDVQMPGSMDGLALIAAIRDRWPPVGLILTSGRVHPPVSAMPAGTRFVSKPYAPYQLRAELDAVLGSNAH
jgi:two-component system, response regulator PdtaR